MTLPRARTRCHREAICGRYTLTTGAEALYEAFDWLERLDEALLDDATREALTKKRYNVAPTHEVPIIGQRDPEHRPKLAIFRWGLVPFWAKSPKQGAKMLNARVETIDTKPAFRKAFAERRCLVPADGWIEWRREGKARIPFHIRRADGQPVLFAGLWERWREKGSDDDWLHSFTVLTRDAAGPLEALHPRMPMLVAPDARERWLIAAEGDDPRPDLLEADLPELTLQQVSRRVNDVRHDDPACLAPASEAAGPA